MDDILIIGAGMAGLSCATALTEAGYKVRVLDKGRGPGGRMAARRAEISGETVSFDHGAQYFTARDPAFLQTVAAWDAQGVVARWDAAGDDAWVGVPGMNGPIKAMAEALNVEWGVRATRVIRDAGIWRIETEGQTYTARALLVSVPAEQARDLLEGVVPELAAIPAQVTSEPCWAVMAGFGERLDIEADCMRDTGAGISWAARNSAKPGRSEEETWVLHASPERSREVLNLSKEDVAELLLADFFAQNAADPVEPVHLTAHRWLYAMPAALKGESAHYDPAARIGIAGDYLHSPRVEGAFLSGRALAKAVISAT